MAWRVDETYWIEVGDSRLECRAWGPPPGEATTIVLLHEGLGSVAQWKEFPEALAGATDCGVFAYSRAGYGKSSPIPLPRPLDYMTREALDVLPDVLDTINFQRGVLLGHSDGASIAAIYAGSVIDFRVRGIAFFAPHFFTEPSGLAAIAEAKVKYHREDLRERLAKYHDDPDNAFCGWNDAWLDPEFKTWNIENVIGYFRIPALAIQGRDDPYGTLAQIEALEAGTYSPVDTEIVDDCKHAPHLEQPEQTLAIVSDFIERLETIEAEIVAVA